MLSGPILVSRAGNEELTLYYDNIPEITLRLEYERQFFHRDNRDVDMEVVIM